MAAAVLPKSASTKLVFTFPDGTTQEIVCVIPTKGVIKKLLDDGYIVNGFKLNGSREASYGHAILLQKDITPELMKNVRWVGTGWPSDFTQLKMVISDGTVYNNMINKVEIVGLFIDEIKNLIGVSHDTGNELVAVKLVESRVLLERFPSNVNINAINAGTLNRRRKGLTNNISWEDGDYAQTLSVSNSHPVYNQRDRTVDVDSWVDVLTNILKDTRSLGGIDTSASQQSTQGLLTNFSTFPSDSPKDIDITPSSRSDEVFYSLLNMACHGIYKVRDSVQYTLRPFGETVSENVAIRSDFDKNRIFTPSYKESKRSRMPESVVIQYRYCDPEETYEIYSESVFYGDLVYKPFFNEVRNNSSVTTIWMYNRVHQSEIILNTTIGSPVENLSKKIGELFFNSFINDQEYDAMYFGIVPFHHSAEHHEITYYQDVDAFKTRTKSIDMKKHVFWFPKERYFPSKTTAYFHRHNSTNTLTSQKPVAVPTSTLFGVSHAGWGFPIHYTNHVSQDPVLRERSWWHHDTHVGLTHASINTAGYGWDANHPKLTFDPTSEVSQLKIHRPGAYLIEFEVFIKFTIIGTLFNFTAPAIYITGYAKWWIAFEIVNGATPTGKRGPLKTGGATLPKKAYTPVLVPSPGTLTIEETVTCEFLVEVDDPDTGNWAPGFFFEIQGQSQLPTLVCNWIKWTRIR